MNNVKVELYNKSFTEKIGDLTNCISCIVKEERNGLFDLDLVYPINDPLFHELKEENIIVCNANDTLKSQKFRIYNTGKLGSNKIQVYAMHISYDLIYDFVKNIDIKNQSCEYALNTLFRNSTFSQDYKGYSDIVNAQNYKMDRANVLQAIAGKQGSIVDTFGTGAEILRDNENIYVLNKRGNDNGVVIEYGVNQTDFKLETDIVELETRIQPRAVYQNEAGEDIEVIAPFVDSPYINDYAHPYINYERDYSDKFENGEVPTVEKLTKFAQDDFKINKIDIPKYNFKIEFIPLSKCVGYEGIRDKISLCDTVTIIDKRYNVNTKAKVIKYEFNVLKDRYEIMELGEPRTKLGDVIIGDDGKDGKPGLPGKDGPIGPQGKPGEPGKDGKTKYTWIKYADDDKGNGMSNLPTNKEYIGLAYNKDTEIESNNASDYTWSKYVGDQGIPGQPGADGKTLYTWLKYADDELGNGMTDIAAGKEYIGLAYNKTVQQESTNPKDYTWSKIKGDQGIPGKPGADGKTKYTWVKYADTPTSGMSDDPANKTYLGLAYNKDVQQESTNYADYTWSKIKGEQGPQGKPGEEFPNTLPSTPIVTLEAGLGMIAISWTFEAKAYYTYEVYASRTKDFTPNTFDLIFKGQASTFSHYTGPKQTWYYRVRAINTHGNSTAFSEQEFATTGIIDKDSQWIGKAAIGDLQVGTLNLDRGWVGQLKGEWIDARQLTVTDGNGKRTLDIDSYGNVNLDVATLKIKSTDVDKSLTEVVQTSKALELKVQGMQDKIGQDLMKNGNFSAGYSEWIVPFEGPISPSNCRIIEHGAIKYISQLEGKNPVLTIAQLDIPVKEKMAYTFKIALAGDKNTDKINCEVVIAQNGVEWSKTNGDDTWGTLDKPGIWQTSYMSTAEGTISIKVAIWNLDGTSVYATDLILLEPGGDYATSQQVAELVIQADKIEQKVSNLDKNTSSSITILNDQIKSKVDSNGVKSVIEQNPKSVQIGFNGINDTFSVTPDEVYMKGSDGNKHLRFYNGKMRVVHPNGSDFGYIGRNKWSGTDIYGMAIDMDYQTSFSVGFDEGMYYLSSFACVKTPFYTDGTFLDKGVHVYEKFITHGAEFVGTQKIADINHPLGSGKGDVGIWTTLDMHNWGIKNTTITKDLKPQTIELKSHIEKNKLDCKTYMCDSSHKDTLIIKCDEIVSTVDNEVIVEIPQIFSENINDDYNIHIHKTTFGDYRIKEQNRYYFIVESDRDISFKWDILATKINTDYNILTLANEPYMVEEPEQLVNCFADKPRNLTKELKESNELWKMYKKVGV